MLASASLRAWSTMRRIRSRSCRPDTAIAIARAAGADRFASEAYETANQKLAAAETALGGKKSSERKTAPGLAREAVIAGEDARRSAMIASAASAAEAERQAAANAATDAANESRVRGTEAATVWPARRSGDRRDCCDRSRNRRRTSEIRGRSARRSAQSAECCVTDARLGSRTGFRDRGRAIRHG